jgi:hypothetical protein
MQTLAEKFPELIKEWHPTRNLPRIPFNVTAFSNKPATWVCPKGHEYSMPISHRTSYHQNCSCCAGRKVCDDNRLSMLFPEIAKQWHPTKNGDRKPSDYTSQSNKKVWWMCDICGYSWEASPNKRVGSGRGCPNCAGKIITKENCLATNYPELVQEWDFEMNYPFTPDDFMCQSRKIAGWKCKRGHRYPMRIGHRVDGHGCPRCFGGSSCLQRFVYWELEVFYKDILYRHKIDGLECDVFIPSENIAIEMDGYRWHKDNCKHDDIKASKLKELGITLVSIRENGLSRGSEKTIFYSKSSRLFDITKELFTLLSKITGNNDLGGYVNNEFSLNRAKYYTEIAGLKNIPKEKQLLFVNPQLASQWDYEKNILTPADVTVYSHDKYYWICEQGHSSFLAEVSNRNKGQGCPKCWAVRRKKST